MGSTFNMISIDDSMVEVVESLKRCNDEIRVINDYAQLGIDIKPFIEKVKSDYNIVSNKSQNNNKVINRITLHVSNSCNLRCKYCYANSGNYNMPISLMSKEDADSFVEFCVNNFDKIKKIIFFGGEPFMNLDIMVYICDSFINKFNHGEFAVIPLFGAITNGTILNKDIIKFIDKYLDFVTISVDGLKEINDENRIFADGSGSFDKISKFIYSVKSETKAKLKFEATYTKRHIELGYSYKDINDDLTKVFGIDGDVVNENSNDLSGHKSTSDYYKNIDLIDFSDMPIDFWNVLAAITLKKENKMCSICQDRFAVSTSGDIYPCQMVVGKHKTCLGNTKSDNIYKSSLLYNDFEKKLLSNKNAECLSCWANKLCGGCTVKRFYNSRDEDFNSSPNRDYCELTKKNFSELILLIAYVRKKPTVWRRLLSYKSKNKL
ncbi:MAG: radical SAM protein [Tannerellaceae bacterium]